MNDSEWVIDTNILYIASNFRPRAKMLQVHHLLTTIWETPQHKVAVDSEGKIEAEYKRCFSISNGRNEFQCQWWIYIKQIARKTVTYSGNLSNKHTNYLIRRLRFHNDDLPFVGVASKTKDKLLVAEESDYTSQVREYLKNNLQVQVMSIEEADNHASQ